MPDQVQLPGYDIEQEDKSKFLPMIQRKGAEHLSLAIDKKRKLTKVPGTLLLARFSSESISSESVSLPCSAPGASLVVPAKFKEPNSSSSSKPIREMKEFEPLWYRARVGVLRWRKRPWFSFQLLRRKGEGAEWEQERAKIWQKGRSIPCVQ